MSTINKLWSLNWQRTVPLLQAAVMVFVLSQKPPGRRVSPCWISSQCQWWLCPVGYLVPWSFSLCDYSMSTADIDCRYQIFVSTTSCLCLTWLPHTQQGVWICLLYDVLLPKCGLGTWLTHQNLRIRFKRSVVQLPASYLREQYYKVIPLSQGLLRLY